MLNRKVLCVEDNLQNLELLCEVVSGEGFDSICANKVADAIDVFKREDPFLVIADLRLQNHVDGSTMADRMHRMNPLCIFVAVSGALTTFDIGYLLGAVFTDIIPKPLDLDVLRKIIRYAWEKRLRWEEILKAV